MNSKEGLGEKPIGGTTDAPVAKANIFCSLDGPPSSKNRTESTNYEVIMLHCTKPISNNFQLPILLGVLIFLMRMFNIFIVGGLNYIVHTHIHANTDANKHTNNDQMILIIHFSQICVHYSHVTLHTGNYCLL